MEARSVTSAGNGVRSGLRVILGGLAAITVLDSAGYPGVMASHVWRPERGEP